MYCTHCGTAREFDQQRFCVTCGSPLPPTTDRPFAADDVARTGSEGPGGLTVDDDREPLDGAGHDHPDRPSAGGGATGMGRRWTRRRVVLVGAAVGVVVLVAAGTAFGLMRQPDRPSASSGSQVSDSVPSTPASQTTIASATNTPTPTARTTASTRPRPTEPGIPIVISGLEGGTYQARVHAFDTLPNCTEHAYGAVQDYLAAHPCERAQRVLATVQISGRRAVVVATTIDFQSGDDDQYGYSAASGFQTLVNSDGTGNVNDLLREGHPIAGVASAMPAHEAFFTGGQDASSWVIEAWWASGTTADQDPTLLAAESRQLFLSNLFQLNGTRPTVTTLDPIAAMARPHLSSICPAPYAVLQESALQLDLTGDGSPEVIVEVTCENATGSSPVETDVYGTTGTSPTLLRALAWTNSVGGQTYDFPSGFIASSTSITVLIDRRTLLPGKSNAEAIHRRMKQTFTFRGSSVASGPVVAR